MVVGARPAMGKTAFAVSLAVNLAFTSGLNVVFFSLEMSKKQIMRRVVSNLAAIDSNRIKYGECSENELKRIYSIQEAAELENLKIFEGSHSLNDITLILSDLKLEKKIDVVVIDYLQKIVPKSKGSRYEQVTEVSNGVKVIAQNMHIPVIALAQLSRDSSKIGKLPTLTDLRESGEIEQDASVVSFLHRPEYYGEELTSNGNRAENICEVLIAKNREGSVGKYEMGVDLSLSKFFDL
jgi:replicative DNA helicase